MTRSIIDQLNEKLSKEEAKTAKVIMITLQGKDKIKKDILRKVLMENVDEGSIMRLCFSKQECQS